MIVKDLDEDGEVISLRVLVDGKVKSFKKDTRTWLHKSSAKAERNKPKLPQIQEKLNKPEDGNNHSNGPEAMEICEEEDNNTNIRKDNFRDALMDSDSADFNGDSDADITYSEADSEQSLNTATSNQPRRPSHLLEETDSNNIDDDNCMDVDDENRNGEWFIIFQQEWTMKQ